MAQTTEQLAAARELATQYGLTAADFFQHKQSKAWLISRTGIEKIQYGAGIEVRFEAVRIEMEYAAVKATGTRATKPTAGLLGSTLRIETFGSASKANCQVSYFLEMAEKRALSRVVLKLSDFYQLGVYGEDEMPPASPERAAVAAEPTPWTDEAVAHENATSEQRLDLVLMLEHPALLESEHRTPTLKKLESMTKERAQKAIDFFKESIRVYESFPPVAEPAA